MSAVDVVARSSQRRFSDPSPARPTLTLRVLARLIDLVLLDVVLWASLALFVQAVAATPADPWLLLAGSTLLLTLLAVEAGFVLFRGHRLGGVLCGLTHVDLHSGSPHLQGAVTKAALQALAGVLTLGVGELIISWLTLNQHTGQHVFDRWAGIRPLRAVAVRPSRGIGHESSAVLTPSSADDVSLPWRGPAPLATRHEVGFIASSPFSQRASLTPAADPERMAHVVSLKPAMPLPEPPLAMPQPRAAEVAEPTLPPVSAAEEPNFDDDWADDDLSYLPGFGALDEDDFDDCLDVEPALDDEPTPDVDPALLEPSVMPENPDVGPLPYAAFADLQPEVWPEPPVDEPPASSTLARVVSLHAPDKAQPEQPSTSPQVPRLRLNEGEPFDLAASLVIGRNPHPTAEDPNAQPWKIVDPHMQVSKTHLMIGLQGQCAWLMDMNSSNGTFVSNKNRRDRIDPMERVPLSPGDVIEFGSHRIEVINE